MANQGKDREKNLMCNFCGKRQDEVERMIIGPGVNICNECIELCHSLLEDGEKNPAPADKRRGRAKPSSPPSRRRTGRLRVAGLQTPPSISNR